jgi:hypothetical protein
MIAGCAIRSSRSDPGRFGVHLSGDLDAGRLFPTTILDSPTARSQTSHSWQKAA